MEHEDNEPQINEVIDQINEDQLNEAILASIEEPNKAIHLLKSAINSENLTEVQEILQNFIIVDSVTKDDPEITININETFTHENEEITLVDLAWKKKNFDIVQILIETNSKFPSDFNEDFTHYGLQIFTQDMKNLNESIKYDDLLKVEEVIVKYPKLTHFYDTTNQSAVLKSIKMEKFQIYDSLADKNITIGPHENAFESLSRRQKKDLKFIHVNFQGQLVVFSKVVEDDFDICANLTPAQIVALMRKEKFSIGDEIKPESTKYHLGLEGSESTVDGPSDVQNFKKIYIISDEPQSGRTTTMKSFASRLKKDFETSWISYVDLKCVWNKSFESFEDVKKLFCKNAFEEALFMIKYTVESPPMRIFWDGLDEVDEVEKVLFLDIIKSIEQHSRVQQWFVTRPFYDQELKNTFVDSTYKLQGLKSEQSQSLLTEILINNLNNVIVDLPYDEIISENKVHNLIDNLERIKIFNEDFDLKSLKFLAEFLKSNLNHKFSSLIDFCEKIFKDFDHKPFQTRALKNFVIENDLNYFITELNNPLSSLEVLKNEEKCEKFPKAFDNFFIAEWIFNNAYFISDTPTEDESALRVNLLLTIVTIDSNRTKNISKILMDFINRENAIAKGYIKSQSDQQRDKFYSTSLQSLPEFKNALIDLFCHDKSKDGCYIEKFCDFFKHDRESLKFLWRFDENETIVNWYRKEFPDIKSEDLIKVARKFFKDDEIEKLKSGKNQIGCKLFNVWWNKQKSIDDKDDKEEFDKKEEEDLIINIGGLFDDDFVEDFKVVKTPNFYKFHRSAILNYSMNFFELIEYLNPILTTDEMLEIFIRNGHKIFYSEVKTIKDFELIFNKIGTTDITEIFRENCWYKKDIIYEQALKKRDSKLLAGYFDNFEKYLSEKAILYHLNQVDSDKSNTPLMMAVKSNSIDIFNTFWDFMIKYIKGDELKKYLLKLDDDKNAAIHFAAVIDDSKFFEKFLDFYLDLFTVKEFRGIFTNENVFLHRMILNSNIENCKAVATLVEVLFSNDMKKLQRFLLQGHESIFGTYKDQEVYRDKLKVFVKLLRRTYDVENEEEMNQLNELLRWNEGFESKFDEEE